MVGAVSRQLMELDKAAGSDMAAQSLTEARLFQAMALDCQRPELDCHVAGIVASAPVTDGAEALRAFLPRLLATAPLVAGIREAIWKQPDAHFVNETYWASGWETGALCLMPHLMTCPAARHRDLHTNEIRVAGSPLSTPSRIRHRCLRHRFVLTTPRPGRPA